LIGLKDKSTIEKLCDFRASIVNENYKTNIKPITLDELEARAIESNISIEKGEVIRLK
jgi:peroxiredoxin